MTSAPSESPSDPTDAANAAETSESTAANESNTAPKRKLLIGSQRDPANRKLTPSKPKPVREAEAAPKPSPKPQAPELEAPPREVATPVDAQREQETSALEPPVQEPPVLDQETPSAAPGPDPSPAAAEEPQSEVPAPVLNETAEDDLEKELQAALGDKSLDELIADEDARNIGEQLEESSRHKATVVKIHRDDVFFSLRGRHQGVTSVKQFKTPPTIGTQMDVVVNNYNAEDGLYELRIPGASIDVADWDDLSDGAVVEARITGANTGGLECLVNNIRGFIPASQIGLYRVDNMSDYINQKLQCVVTEANPNRRNLVLSHRALLERQREENREKFLEQLEVGTVCDGVVSKIMDFGAFVDLGSGIDGLVHISKLSWDRVEHPSEVVKEGQPLRVKVESVDKQSGKISLTYRDLLEHPWDNVDQKYPVNSIVTGKVSRVAKFGAFVRLESGIEGLIHISELAHHRVVAVTNVVNEGDEVEVKILSLDRDAQRMALSLKATQSVPEPAKAETAEEEDEPLRELSVPRSNKPLKGGTDKKSGGEQFGLNW